jgi:hypothetical protein
MHSAVTTARRCRACSPSRCRVAHRASPSCWSWIQRRAGGIHPRIFFRVALSRLRQIAGQRERHSDRVQRPLLATRAATTLQPPLGAILARRDHSASGSTSMQPLDYWQLRIGPARFKPGTSIDFWNRINMTDSNFALDAGQSQGEDSARRMSSTATHPRCILFSNASTLPGTSRAITFFRSNRRCLRSIR